MEFSSDLPDQVETSTEQRWNDFLTTYNKNYSKLELKTRKAIFIENIDLIDRHNLLYKDGISSYGMAVNHLTDLTQTEVLMTFKGYTYKSKGTKGVKKSLGDVDLPSYVNWVEQNVVSYVKNQGRCGSCYAFSATGSLEGQYARKYNTMVYFSEQDIIDCSGSYGNNGCYGGLMDNVFEYVMDNGGLDTESQYPYEGTEGTCRSVKNPFVLSKFVDVIKGDEKELEKAVSMIGPISVGIDASKSSFQHYSEGVYYESLCSSENLDHGVLLVGYGVENGMKYWLVKNSWGANWGESGYIKMSRDENNQCGIASSASYPVLG